MSKWSYLFLGIGVVVVAIGVYFGARYAPSLQLEREFQKGSYLLLVFGLLLLAISAVKHSFPRPLPKDGT